MKKATKKGSGKRAVVRREPPMRAGYAFSGGVRGKYAKRFAAGSNVVVLEPDVARAFRTAKAVNAALRRTLRATAEKRGRLGRRGEPT